LKSSDFPVAGQPTSPKAPAHPAPLALVSVPFRGGFIEAAQFDGEVWVPVRPVCDALGLAWQPQLKKLRAKPWANTCDTFMVSESDDQRRRFSCVDLRSLPLWLATIEPSRVKPEARPALVAYQREAAEVLYRHFLAPAIDASALARLAAELDQLRSEVQALRGRDRRRTRSQEPAPLGMGSRLNEEDAARVRAYCETRPIVATADVMREALGLATWSSIETSALAIELRALGYERRKTYQSPPSMQRYAWRWRRPNTALTLVLPEDRWDA
jgi:hypothetical protein